MTTDTLTRPDTAEPGTGEGLVAHIVLADQSLEAMVTGGEVVALCGLRWVPCRDPERLPRCPDCVELLADLGGPGARRRLEQLNGRETL